MDESWFVFLRLLKLEERRLMWKTNVRFRWNRTIETVIGQSRLGEPNLWPKSIKQEQKTCWIGSLWTSAMFSIRLPCALISLLLNVIILIQAQRLVRQLDHWKKKPMDWPCLFQQLLVMQRRQCSLSIFFAELFKIFPRAGLSKSLSLVQFMSW